MNTLHPTIAAAINPFISNPTDNILRAVELFAKSPASHEDIATVIASFAVMLESPNALTDACIQVVTDMCDEIVGQIEQDEVNQLAEVTA